MTTLTDTHGSQESTVHGFRLRSDGSMLRVSRRTRTLDDDVSEFDVHTYSFSRDPADPVYDAGSLQGLERAFLPSDGGDPRRPLPNGIAREDVDPVAIVETVTRRTVTVAVTALAERPVLVSRRAHPVSLDASWIARVEGLEEVFGAVADHEHELQEPGDEGGPKGDFRLLGYLTPDDPSDLRDDVLGAAVCVAGGGSLSRGLAVLPYEGTPGLTANGIGPIRSLVVCLFDLSPVPDGLVESLRSLSAPGPSPR